ncbi:uncharacterized protein LOC112084505 [Eutrema salsugineum]|uniref:uncharacterized protein LOC112084505 n=1 Tax=Eutrema salsugineum TaxID=72664 RepID=UPI000CED643D|nr:uncharacterized protein LOC112084505 [Eutrema salsugineum]
MAQRNGRQAQQNQQQANRNEQQAQNIPQPQPHAQRQPPQVFVGENDRENAHQHRAGIQAPPVQNNNFEVKASLLNMVQNSKFHRLPMEDSLEHLDQFDRRSTSKIRNQLDTASNENVLGKEINAALELVENLAMSDDTYGEDFDRANRSEGSSKELRMEKDIRELQKKLDKVLVATQKPLHFVGEFDDQGPSFENVNEDGLTQEEINYIGNQNRIGGSKYAAMQQEIKDLRKNQAPTSRKQGTLPGKPEPNPKEYCNAITLRSGKELPEREPRQVLIEDNEQVSGEAAQKSEKEKEITKGNVTKEVEQEMVPEKPYVPPPPYQPKLPFPGRFKKQIPDKARAIFEKHLENIKMTMPIIEAFLMVPQPGKFLKDAILNKTKKLQGMVILSHECSAIIQRKTIPRKLSDPGSFTLPCTIGPLKFDSCLCNLGDSVSLMPYSIAKRLGYNSYKPARISLLLADRSVRLPIGLLEDFPLKVSEIEIPTDFIVFEMDEEPVDPLILGRPFLATAGAIFDVRGGMIELHIGSETMKFDVKEMMKKPTLGGQIFYIETMEELADELLEELNTEDPLQVVLKKEQGEHGYLAEESEAYKLFLDQPKELDSETRFLELGANDLEVLDIRGSNTSQGPAQGCMAVGSQAEEKAEPCEQINTKGAATEHDSFNADWDESKAPPVELKPLPTGLRPLPTRPCHHK